MAAQLSNSTFSVMPEISVSYMTGVYKKEDTQFNLDPLFEEAAILVVMYQIAGPSILQRLLKTNYMRSAKIIDQMETLGIIGAFRGDQAREVYYKNLKSLEKLFIEKSII